ncbi:MAG: GNAT family N-acetyltransferase/peptidase C39 family protein [Rhodocyclaceae bacterium]|nr:GNAT family N-acetyltransferase/peptidase C39 family protein [Rhodocyclaceae bacterium]
MLRRGELADVDALVALEDHCFLSDKLSRRSFRYMLTRANASVLVDAEAERLRGYVLLLYSNGCSMARLYSIAVDPDYKGQGVGGGLIEAAEREAVEHDCVSMRLEIRKDNPASLALFNRHGYRPFKEVLRYYEDDMDALRFEKSLAPQLGTERRRVPFYRQTLDFTCGPSSLMMAMKALDDSIELSRTLELRIWREATTVFMTSGHGGCGPYGLALSAYHRGFDLEIHVNDDAVFLGDSVRDAEKKEVMRLVQEDFLDELSRLPIPVHHGSVSVETMQALFEAGAMLLVLISSHAIYRERFPHWVVVTGFDEHFIYVHDPLVQYEKGEALADSLHMPIPKRQFRRMARYGKAGQKAVLALSRRDAQP